MNVVPVDIAKDEKRPHHEVAEGPPTEYAPQPQMIVPNPESANPSLAVRMLSSVPSQKFV
jgi:hypothetical protein